MKREKVVVTETGNQEEPLWLRETDILQWQQNKKSKKSQHSFMRSWKCHHRFAVINSPTNHYHLNVVDTASWDTGCRRPVVLLTSVCQETHKDISLHDSDEEKRWGAITLDIPLPQSFNTKRILYKQSAHFHILLVTSQLSDTYIHPGTAVMQGGAVSCFPF